MFGNNFIYKFVPIGVVLVAGLIQTAVILMTFTVSQWDIALILGVCVWLTCSADGFVYHEITTTGGTPLQYIAVGISGLFLVGVLGIDLVVLFAPAAFQTTDPIIHNLQYGTGVNLAVSLLCLLLWLFASKVNEHERDAAAEEQLLIRQLRLDYLKSDRARELIEQDVENDHATRMAKRQKVSPHTILQTVKASKNGNHQKADEKPFS